MKFSDDQIAAAIKQLVARGKERGDVTFEELDAALPADQVSSEQIEDAMSLLSELGIKVVDTVLRARPVEGEIDHEALSREFMARYPKLRAALAK